MLVFRLTLCLTSVLAERAALIREDFVSLGLRLSLGRRR
jgi:hypothetical protein